MDCEVKPKELVNRLRKIPTASLSDALNKIGVYGTMSYEFRPVIPGVKIVGFAVTIKDVASRRVAPPMEAINLIDSCEPGSVVVRVVEGLDARNIALYGGLMALASKVRGLAGAVLDGATRDVVELREMGFQVFCRSFSPNTSVGRTEVAAVNVPVVCGGVKVRPGDIVVGDDDGVVVIPRDQAVKVIELAEEIDRVEKMEAEEIAKGIPFAEVLKKYMRV